MKIIPTIAAQQFDALGYGGTQQSDNAHDNVPFVDASIESPDQQFQVLVGMLEANDAQNPAPNTGTPPWGETINYNEYIPEVVQQENYMPAPDVQAMAESDLLPLLSDAYGNEIPAPEWENDQQYHGLGVPPGVPNWGQPIESGHSQITVINPSAELGWDAWSGRGQGVARVARHENDFKGYSAGTSRGHMIPVKLLQNRGAATYLAQRQWQARNLMLSELNKRGIHNVVIADVPAQTYNEQVAVVDPTLLVTEAPIGPEGVLP